MSGPADDATRTLDRCNAKLRWCMWMTAAMIATNLATLALLCRIDAALPAPP